MALVARATSLDVLGAATDQGADDESALQASSQRPRGMGRTERTALVEAPQLAQHVVDQFRADFLRVAGGARGRGDLQSVTDLRRAAGRAS